MEKITKKAFVELLCNNQNIFCDCVHDWNDGRLLQAADRTKINPHAERRTVKSIHSTFIEFSNDSRLYLDQKGEKEYYFHKNPDGIDFIWQKLSNYDNFYERTITECIIYILEASC